MRPYPQATVRLLAIVALTIAPAFAAGDKPDTPTSVKGATVITVDDARALLEKKAATFFDMRNPLNFGRGHLPGATLLAYKEKSEYQPDFDASLDSFDLARLPADRNATIVLYSDGPKGWKSYKASVLAVKAGYTRLFWMRDGFAGWTAKSLPVDN
ncbi:MAG: rhodanese-like domain-containing protein [Candidatus Accumulibacter sp.]|uniref:rhodanese-like domain-containing protein n=1 Tax=Accumulibacter sp. TaxID=2053492 RepID=UPI0025FE9744|nr:rhodanese-like domain-containing protein [Accumulibacter sp.]MCP5249142.1 rhodanese-like domain-containing protein [Accumulibacter sp.]